MGIFYSCSSDNDDTRFESQAIILSVESEYVFKAGDAIGIFVEKRSNQDTPSTVGNSKYKTNIKWVYQEDDSWKPAGADDMIYTSSDGKPLDIYAYYPYTADVKNNEITISTASPVMTGKVLNINNQDLGARVALQAKASLVKIIVPDMDILSPAEVNMMGVISGGTIDLAKLGEAEDFKASSVKSNQQLTFTNGHYSAYLPEQVFEKNKLLLNIKQGNSTTEFNLPEEFSITKDKDNTIVANLPATNAEELPNTFMLKPGDEIFVSVQKAYRMWKTNSLLASTSPDLNGNVSVKIVWQEDLLEVIENIETIGSGENSVIHIKTKTGKTGNAVIAVKIGENIRWSWQLWVSDYNPSLKENGTTYDFNGQTFMDRNLGATADPKAGGDRTFGLYYQWGRKDPFQTRGKLETIAVEPEVKTNLSNSITNPGTFITSSSGQNDWYTKTGNTGLDRWNSDGGKKTAFDPCPKGWRVPVTNTDNESPWSGLTLPEDESKWGNGWHFEGTNTIGYYPAAGQLTATGTPNYTGSAGFYHTAVWGSTMRIDFTSINLSFGGGKAAARSVRCLKE